MVVVTRGSDVGMFTDWYVHFLKFTCQARTDAYTSRLAAGSAVSAVSRNIHKGYANYGDAQRAWINAVIESRVSLIIK